MLGLINFPSLTTSPTPALPPSATFMSAETSAGWTKVKNPVAGGK
jgi:hypothetical protein